MCEETLGRLGEIGTLLISMSLPWRLAVLSHSPLFSRRTELLSRQNKQSGQRCIIYCYYHKLIMSSTYPFLHYLFIHSIHDNLCLGLWYLSLGKLLIFYVRSCREKWQRCQTRVKISVTWWFYYQAITANRKKWFNVAHAGEIEISEVHEFLKAKVSFSPTVIILKRLFFPSDLNSVVVLIIVKYPSR